MFDQFPKLFPNIRGMRPRIFRCNRFHTIGSMSKHVQTHQSRVAVIRMASKFSERFRPRLRTTFDAPPILAVVLAIDS
jgi:hypothetical protein